MARIRSYISISLKMFNVNIHQQFNRIWYQGSRLYYFLLPLTAIFYLLSQIRKLYYTKIYRRKEFFVPVITVGNLTVGGSGKTPMVLYLVTMLKEKGYQPGVIARGYKSKAYSPIHVDEHCSAADVGDEPLLVFHRTRIPVVVGRDRIKNLNYLVENFSCDIVICDDGLQDYRFMSAVELVMVDGERKFGNQHLLPAGPLREPVSRLSECDYVIASNRPIPELTQYSLSMKAVDTVKLNKPDVRADIDSWAGTTVHAVAGIACPDRFFNMLEKLGINTIKHPFPDHADFEIEDLTFNDQLPVFMTEKDAVKCHNMDLDNTWYIPVDVIMSTQFVSDFNTRLRAVNG